MTGFEPEQGDPSGLAVHRLNRTAEGVVPRMHVSCHAYECVMSHVWMRHVTHVDKP